MNQRPYRPSNGTEGLAFEADFCDRCRRGRGREPACRIWAAALSLHTGERGFPSEWVDDPDLGPLCTAFDDASSPAKPRAGFRCRKTSDLFGNAP